MEKVCPKCEESKPATEENFFRRKTGRLYSYCKLCQRNISSEWIRNKRRNNPEFKKITQENTKAYIASVRATPEGAAHLRKMDAKSAKKRRDTRIVVYRRWCVANRMRIKNYKHNKELAGYQTMLKRAAKLQATPRWADRFAISGIYAECKRRRELGESCEVDHIVPLRGRNVCGLHIDWNLKIIPSRENLLKGNKLLPHVSAGAG